MPGVVGQGEREGVTGAVGWPPAQPGAVEARLLASHAEQWQSARVSDRISVVKNYGSLNLCDS